MARKLTYQDWINKDCPINEGGGEPDNPQEQRARELVACNYHKDAFSILNCAHWFCRKRMCPACSLRLSHERRSKMQAAVGKMKDPKLALFKVDSKDMKAASLRAALNTLVGSIARMRRKGALRTVERAIGGVEVVPFRTKSGMHLWWNAHAHVIFDLPARGFAETKVRRMWSKITKTQGSVFGLEEIRSEVDVIRYLSKSRDVCPESGILPTWELKQFMLGTKGRRFLIGWGLARPGAQEPEEVSIDELFDDDIEENSTDRSIREPGYKQAPATIRQGKRSTRSQIRQPRERRWIIRIRRSKNSTLAPFIQRSRPKIDSAANRRSKSQKPRGRAEKTRSE